mgnify:CR=1 FL=1
MLFRSQTASSSRSGRSRTGDSARAARQRVICRSRKLWGLPRRSSPIVCQGALWIAASSSIRSSPRRFTLAAVAGYVAGRVSVIASPSTWETSRKGRPMTAASSHQPTTRGALTWPCMARNTVASRSIPRCDVAEMAFSGGVRRTSGPSSVASSSVRLALPPLRARDTRAPLSPVSASIHDASGASKG